MIEGFIRDRVKVTEVTLEVATGGAGPALLLLHGYPQTHEMWHRVAPLLASQFSVVAADLRGYGDSSKPPSVPDHATYSKRAMARDMVELMEKLGHREFMVAGHDRGARVGHRMALDWPQRVKRLAVLDIAPTREVFAAMDKRLATAYYHWFFLIQPRDLPERLIGADPAYYLQRKLASWGTSVEAFDPEAVKEYVRCFSDPAVIHASCEDYRAAAGIDLRHDEADIDTRVACPLLVLWGAQGVLQRCFDVLATWRERAADVQGFALDCGHFLPEEKPGETAAALERFFAAGSG